MFPLAAPLGGMETTAADNGSTSGRGDGEDLLLGYRREQEAVLERVETGACFEGFGC